MSDKPTTNPAREAAILCVNRMLKDLCPHAAIEDVQANCAICMEQEIQRAIDEAVDSAVDELADLTGEVMELREENRRLREALEGGESAPTKRVARRRPMWRWL